MNAKRKIFLYRRGTSQGVFSNACASDRGHSSPSKVLERAQAQGVPISPRLFCADNDRSVPDEDRAGPTSLFGGSATMNFCPRSPEIGSIEPFAIDHDPFVTGIGPIWISDRPQNSLVGPHLIDVGADGDAGWRLRDERGPKVKIADPAERELDPPKPD